MASRPTPIHLIQTGTDTDPHEIQRGSIIQAIEASQNAAPMGRNVARMNIPSCRRSSFSRVACDLTLW